MSACYRLAVATLVLNENKQILLVEHKYRGWEFPGGFVDENESIKAAAIREVQEESGIEIKITRLLGIEQNLETNMIIHIFEGETIGGELISSTENVDVGFFQYNEAEQLITLERYKTRLERCFNHDITPFII